MNVHKFTYNDLAELKAVVSEKEVLPKWKEDNIKARGYECEKAVNMLTVGDYDNAKRIKASAFVRNTAAISKRTTFSASVVGCLPNVPAYINGLPKQMYNVTRKPSKCKVLNIFVHVSCCCGISSEQIVEAGAKVANIVAGIEKKGIRVNLYAVDTAKVQENVQIICARVKKAEAPLNLLNMAFCFINENFLRRVCFLHMERRFPFYDAGYGQVWKEEEELKNALGDGLLFETERIIENKLTTEALENIANEYIAKF